MGGIEKKSERIYKGSALGLEWKWDEKCGCCRFFSNDEDNFDAAGDVAKSGMNGVCARPIGPSDLLYGGTTTYCTAAMYGLVAHFSLVVYGGAKGG